MTTLSKDQDILNKYIDAFDEAKSILQEAGLSERRKETIIDNLKDLKIKVNRAVFSKKKAVVTYAHKGEEAKGPACDIHKLLAGDINEALGLPREGSTIQNTLNKRVEEFKSIVNLLSDKNLQIDERSKLITKLKELKNKSLHMTESNTESNIVYKQFNNDIHDNAQSIYKIFIDDIQKAIDTSTKPSELTYSKRTQKAFEQSFAATQNIKNILASENVTEATEKEFIELLKIVKKKSKAAQSHNVDKIITYVHQNEQITGPASDGYNLLLGDINKMLAFLEKRVSKNTDLTNITKTPPNKLDKAMVDVDLQKNMTSAPQKQKIMSFSFKDTGRTYQAGGGAGVMRLPGGMNGPDFLSEVKGAADDTVDFVGGGINKAVDKAKALGNAAKGKMITLGRKATSKAATKSRAFFQVSLDAPGPNMFMMSEMAATVLAESALGREYGEPAGVVFSVPAMYLETAYHVGGVPLLHQMGQYYSVHPMTSPVIQSVSNNIRLTGGLLRQYAAGAGMIYVTAKTAGAAGTEAAITYAAAKAGAAAATTKAIATSSAAATTAKITAPVATVYAILLSPQFMQGNAAEMVNGKKVISKSIQWLAPVTNPLNVRGIMDVMVNGKDGGKPVNLTPEQQAKDFNIQRMISTGQLKLKSCMMAPSQNTLLQK